MGHLHFHSERTYNRNVPLYWDSEKAKANLQKQVSSPQTRSTLQVSERAMIRVNDQYDVDYHPGMTVQDVLNALRFTFKMIVVKIDGKVILRRDFSSTPVPDGARVEAIHLISGG
jgi:sulfur carrier protein